jgi:hypothetical protein
VNFGGHGANGAESSKIPAPVVARLYCGEHERPRPADRNAEALKKLPLASFQGE